jgi:hypothetical protein
MELNGSSHDGQRERRGATRHTTPPIGDTAGAGVNDVPGRPGTRDMK